MTKRQIGHPKKRAMLKALEDSFGIVATAARAVDISRSIHYEWLENDEYYRDAVEDIKEAAIDHVEGCLFSNINALKETSIIFFLKTRGKHRGYSEQVEAQQGEYEVIEPEVPPLPDMEDF